MKRKLLPEHRSRMRQLLGGFVQHCEISHNLSGSIDLFVESQGHKFGLPVFTFYGPSQRGIDTRFIGLLACNDGADKRASEALLQLLERLVLQPNLATGLIVSALPISDPISLESDNDAHPISLKKDLDDRLRDFAARALDGLIEISLSPREQPTVDVEGPTYIRDAAINASKTIDRLGREMVSNPFKTRLSLRGSSESDYWKIRINVCEKWSESLVTHWVSQFLVVLLRSRIEEQLRNEEFGYTDEDNLIPFTKTHSNRQTAIPENLYD